MLWVFAAIGLIGAAAWGPVVSNVEQAKYDIVQSEGAIEIRDYAPMIIARTEVSGEREEAISKGFRIIADYIFGNNSPKQNVAMTAPVMQKSDGRIAIADPAMQEVASGIWSVSFVMPYSYNMETLPKPNNAVVHLAQIPGKRFVAIRFSGMSGKENLQKHENELNSFISNHKLEPLSNSTYAFFNPPWTLPLLRRNEVMVEIAK